MNKLILLSTTLCYSKKQMRYVLYAIIYLRNERIISYFILIQTTKKECLMKFIKFFQFTYNAILILQLYSKDISTADLYKHYYLSSFKIIQFPIS